MHHSRKLRCFRRLWRNLLRLSGRVSSNNKKLYYHEQRPDGCRRRCRWF
ncbi:MAG: hypothetical protein DRP66_05590 [Planctomycetota bacterium]|nr:MAG: hypothetical protein DRP66_05590 [Planctomycetota bacterium]